MNHPFIDGNKRTGHAIMEIFLYLNGYEIKCMESEQETVILKLASGKLSRNDFKKWLKAKVIKR